jgi:Domain of unknown function (DUF6438)
MKAMILLFSVAACSQSANIRPGPTVAEAITHTPSRGDSLHFERGGCFGRCPVYRVDVDADGQISYEGEAYVVTIGKASGRASPRAMERIQSVVSELKAIADLDPKGCASWHTDDFDVTISIRTEKGVKTFADYHGCERMKDADQDQLLKRLREIEDSLDGILNVEHWIGTREQRRAVSGFGP